MKIPKGIVTLLALVVADGVLAQIGEAELPDQARERLLGQWYYELNVPGGGRIVAYRFEIDESNRLVGSAEFIGFADLPAQLRNVRMPVRSISVEGDDITFEVPSIGSRFVGEFRRERIVGTATRPNGSEELRVTLRKGQYTIPYALDLTDEQIRILQGTWVGEIDAPTGVNENIFRFEILNDGKLHGYLDNPTSGQIGMIIRRLSLKEGKLKLETVFPPGDFSGDIEGNDLTGGWRPIGARFAIPARYRKVD